MTLELEFSPAARIEFDDGADWYLRQEPSLRAQFIAAVDAALAAILQSPNSFPVVFGSNIRRARVNKFPYVIHYIVQPDRILIYSVFHTSRNPIIWQGRID